LTAEPWSGPRGLESRRDRLGDIHHLDDAPERGGAPERGDAPLGSAAQRGADRRPVPARFWPARCAVGRATLVRRAPARPAAPRFAVPPRCCTARFAPAAFLAAGARAPLFAPAAPPGAARFRIAVVFLAAAVRFRRVCPAAASFGAPFLFAWVPRAEPVRAVEAALPLRAPVLPDVLRRVGADAVFFALAPPAVLPLGLLETAFPASSLDIARAA
jgi:hypothetical protein